MLSSFVFGAFAASVSAYAPEGLYAALQEVANNKSRQYNCSISIAFLQGPDAINAAAAPDRMALPNEMYAFGSGTKPLTGSSILKLVAEGRLHLDDLVAPLIDPFLEKMAMSDSRPPWRRSHTTMNFTRLGDIWGADRLGNLTIRSLLTMKSGVPDFDYGAFRAFAYEHPEEVFTPVDLMNRDTIRYGAWFNDGFDGIWYSTTNYMLLGFVLAHFAGVRNWEEYDQGAFLPPTLKHRMKFALRGTPKELGVVAPAFDRTTSNMPAGVTNNKDTSDVNGVFAGWTGSNVYASAPDMAAMIQAIYGKQPQIARGEYAELMRNVSYGTDWYGYATFNLNDRTGQSPTSKYGIAYGHLGATYGYQSIMAYLPGMDITLVVATNIETPHQLHPSDVFCFSYGAIAKQYFGKDLNCTFEDAGYYTGGCKCNDIEDGSQILVV